MKLKSAVSAVIVAAGVIGGAVLGYDQSSSSAESPQCEGPFSGTRTSTLGGFKDKYKTAADAVRADVKNDLKDAHSVELEKDHTDYENGKERSKYIALRDDRIIATYLVEERPEGGFEVGGMQVCAEVQQPDPAQP